MKKSCVASIWRVCLIAMSALAALFWAPPAATSAISPTQESAPGLQGTTWRWVEFVNPLDELISVPSPENYTIEFLAGNRVSGKSDCNSYTGTYRQTGYELFVGRLSATKTCSEDSVSQAFQTGLLATRSFTREGEIMVMILISNAGKMRFMPGANNAPAPTPTPQATPSVDGAPAGLGGKVWKWRQYVGYNETKITVPDPANYSLEFFANGTMVVNADCGRATTGFAASDAVLHIDGVSVSGFRCESPSLMSEFSRMLAYASGYKLEDQQLVINLAMDLGAMVFTSGDPAPQPAETTLPTQLWQWDAHISSTGKAIAPKEHSLYTLALEADGTFSFRADCNLGKGAYAANGNTLDMSIGAVTTGRCAKDTLSKTFMRFLDDVTGFTVMGDHLYLDVKYDTGVMSFSKSDAKPVQKTFLEQTWRWRSFTSEEGERTTNTRLSSYTLTFLPGGRVTVLADCARSMGHYVLDGSRLTLKFPRLINAFCGDKSLADEFARWVDDVSGFSLERNTLTLNLKYDSGTLQFIK